MATNNKKRKKQAYPMVQAHQISFQEQSPQPYYTKEEQDQHKQSSNIYGTSSDPVTGINIPPSVYNPMKKMGPAVIKSDESESDQYESDISDDNEMKKQSNNPNTNQPKKRQFSKEKETAKLKKSSSPKQKQKTQRQDAENESKGLLDKAVSIVKDVVPGKNEEKKEIIRTRVVIELPRDVLTAFFLIRLPRDASRGVSKGSPEYGTTHWDDYDIFGKVFLWISVLAPYMVQWFVLAILLTELADKWEEVQGADSTADFWYNTVAFTVLFISMWKDLAAFYFSVWRYIAWLQKRQGGIMKNLKEAVVDATEVAKTVVSDENDNNKGAKVSLAEDAVDEMATAFRFIEFRLWLLSVVVLYFGLTCYSLLSIPLAEGLLDKLEVSLSVFFVLEVDDWAYELFFAQANILDDEEFDVRIILEKDRNAFQKQKQKQLATTVILVAASIMGFWAIGWALNELN